MHTAPHVIYSGPSAFQVKHLSCGPHQRYVLETTRRCLCQHTPTLAVDCTFYAERGRKRERERERERERRRERTREKLTFPFFQVCVELAKVLLHLSDQYYLDDFVSLRMSAMVSLAVCSPDLVAPYLTDEFYAPNFSLRQRMDILEVHLHNYP